MLTKTILKEEIKKTKETVKKLNDILVEQDKKHKQLIKDCEIGITLNTFVLDKLQEEYELMA